MSSLNPADNHVAVLGQRPLGSLLGHTQPAEIPASVETVLVQWRDDDMTSLLKQVRASCPGARVISWLQPQEHECFDACLSMGFDDVAIGDAQALSRAREEQISRKKLANLRRFEYLFERATDGILVITPQGIIGYSNASAKILLGGEGKALNGMMFSALFHPASQPTAKRALEGYDVGDRRGYVDLHVCMDSGDERVISASVRHFEGATGALVTFRDVTEQRALKSELQQTKEFLENLIQSSVDAIIAADMTGRTILFNRSAERILGYSAEEAVGYLDVRDIYKPGRAYEIMKMLRSEVQGGVGRLELIRRNLVAKNGEIVPINLTAAMIYEGEEEIATVGIFTDLRERIRMEKRLEKAQEELHMSERQAIAVELAGAAAHELNQPLTSVMGYSELLRKRIGDCPKDQKAIGTICRETGRIAQIVKRLGKITRYEKRPYIRDLSILKISEGDCVDEKS